MKKFLIFALILAVAGGAFAQSTTFSGSVGTGLGIRFSDTTDPLQSDPQITLWNMGDWASQLNFNVTGTNASGTGTVHFGWRFTNFGATTSDSLDFNIRYTFLDGLLQLVAGRGGPGGFGVGGSFSPSYDVGGGTGVSFIFRNLVDGLQFGFAIHPGTATYTNFDRNNYSLAVRYTLDGIGTFAAAAQYQFVAGALVSEPNIPAQRPTATDPGNPNHSAINAAFGVNLTPLVRDFGLTNLGIDFEIQDALRQRYFRNVRHDYITLRMSQAVTYVTGDITVGLTARQTMRLYEGTEPANYAPNLRFTGWVQYAMAPLTPRLDFGFVMGNAPPTTGAGGFRDVGSALPDGIFVIPVSGANHPNNFATDTPAGKGLMGFALNPSLAWALDRSTLTFGYAMSIDLSDPLPPIPFAAAPGNPRITFRNQLYVNWTMSF